MREILFRGKRIDNGEWVEGWYYKRIVHLNTFHQNVVVDAIKVYDGENPLSIAYYNVDPETVGEYTGLNANGKKIFEGDIVQAHFRTNHSVQKFEVTMADGMFLFDNRHVKVPRYDIYDLKVIGNIHDSPELLKGENLRT